MSGGLLVGTNWYQGMFYPDSKGLVTISGALAGGHEWYLRGVDVKRRVVSCLNSWSDQWGVKGKFYLTFDTLNTLLNQQGDVILPVQ
jgi:hypothetical protein